MAVTEVAFTAIADAVVVVSVKVNPAELVPENFQAKFGVLVVEKEAELVNSMVNNLIFELAETVVPLPDETFGIVLLKKSVEPLV